MQMPLTPAPMIPMDENLATRRSTNCDWNVQNKPQTCTVMCVAFYRQFQHVAGRIDEDSMSNATTLIGGQVFTTKDSGEQFDRIHETRGGAAEVAVGVDDVDLTMDDRRQLAPTL